MIRRLRAVFVIVTGLALPLAIAGPAGAGSGPPPGTGCGGSACSVSLEKLVHFSGNWSAGTNNPVTIPPPPCLWEPIGDGQTGSQQIVSEWGPNPPTSYDIDKSYAQAQQLLKQHPPPAGTWYMLPVTPAASPAARAADPAGHPADAGAGQADQAGNREHRRQPGRPQLCEPADVRPGRPHRSVRADGRRPSLCDRHRVAARRLAERHGVGDGAAAEH